MGPNGIGGSILTHGLVPFYPMYGVKWPFNTLKYIADSKKNEGMF